jgi:hypothetical protein
VWQHDTIQFSAGSLIVVGFTTSGGRDETGCPEHVTGAYPENCEDSIDGSLCTLTCPDPPTGYSTYVAAGEYMPTGHDGAVQCYDGDWNVPDPTAVTTEPAFPYCQFVGTSFDDLGHPHAPGKSAPKGGKAYGKAMSAGTVDGSAGGKAHGKAHGKAGWKLAPVSKKKKKNKTKGKGGASHMTGDSKASPKKNGFIGLTIGLPIGLLVVVGAVIAFVRKRRHQATTSKSKSKSDSVPSLQLGSNAPGIAMEHFSVDTGIWDTHGETAHSDVDNGSGGGAAACELK